MFCDKEVVRKIWANDGIGGDKMKIQKGKKNGVFVLLVFLFLIIFTLTLILLLTWGVSTSLKSVAEFRKNKLGFPKEFAWENYSTVFNNFSAPVGEQFVYIDTMILNSILYCVGTSIIAMVTPFICAYLTVKFKYKFGKLIYGIVLVTMMLPIIGSEPSTFRVLNVFGLTDSIFAMYILKMNFLGIYFLLFCATVKGIPQSFSEAAYLDGASEMSILIRIIFPMAKNTILVIFLLGVIATWNDYQSVILYFPSFPTIAYGVFDLSRSTDSDLSFVPMQMAGMFLVMVPTLIVFVIFHDKMMGNLSMGGLKE